MKLRYNPNVTTLNLPIKLLTAYVFSTVRDVYNYLQYNVIWQLTGTRSKVIRAAMPDNYGESAHVLKIIGRHKLDVIMGPANAGNFILTHQKFVHPSYVLRDNVTLYSADEKQAVFVEMKDNVCIWQNEYGPFLRESQFFNAVRVIVLPFYAMTWLAAEVGDPQAKLIFIWNIARCGSVLTSRAFEETGKCIVLREPDALNTIAVYSETKNPEIVRQIGQNVVRLLSKKVQSNANVDAYVFKATSSTLVASALVHSLFPDSKHVFLYRDALRSSVCLEKLTHKLPLLKLFYLLSSVSGETVGKLYMSFAGLAQPNMPRCNHPVEYGIHRWAYHVQKYDELKKEIGANLGAILYEDFIKDPEFVLSRLFDFCGLDVKLVGRAMGALNADSQELSCLSDRELKKYKDINFGEVELKKCRQIMNSYGFPELEKEYVLPGMISRK